MVTFGVCCVGNFRFMVGFLNCFLVMRHHIHQESEEDLEENKERWLVKNKCDGIDLLYLMTQPRDRCS